MGSWTVAVLATGMLASCDPAVSRPAPSTVQRSASMPELAPPVVCPTEIPTFAEPIETAALGPFGDLWLRDVDDMVVLDATRTLVAGTHGDFVAEGPYLVAFDLDGAVAWSTSETLEVATTVHLEAVDGEAWVLANDDDGQTGVWRYSPEGDPSVAVIVPELWTETWTPTPGGGLLLAGRAAFTFSAAPAFVELAADGTVSWRGDEDVATFDRAFADGVVHRRDATTELWQHDPRPTPFAGFPLDVGARWARRLDSGEVVAHGVLVGEGGDTALLLRLDASGRSLWSETRPRVTIETAHVRDDGSIELRGEARECTPSRWAARIDAAGETIFDGQVAGTRGVFGLDGAGRAIAVEVTQAALEWQRYTEVQR